MPSAAPPDPHTPPTVDVATWATTLDAAPTLDLGDLAPAGARLLLVSAHPDDETIGAGRLAAAWAARTGPVDAVVLTAGEACYGDTGAAAAEVGRTRLREWDEAVTALGGVPHGCAHLPDHDLAAHESTVVDILTALAPAVDALAVTWDGDPHPDHVVAGRAAARVATDAGLLLLRYPVWTTYRRRPDEVGEPLVRLRTDAAADDARRRALACYPSQLAPREGRGPVVDPSVLEHHRHQLLVGVPR